MERCPLHVVSDALPLQVGYTLRTHQLLSAQARIGLRPACLITPVNRVHDSDHIEPPRTGVRYVDGVSYCRLTESRLSRRIGVRCSQWLRDRSVKGAWRFGMHLDIPDDRWAPLFEWARSKGSFNVVHAHTPLACGEAGLRLARMLGRPFVYEVRGFWDLTAQSEGGRTLSGGLPLEEARAREVALANAADAVVTLGHTMRDELVKRGVDAARIRIVGNGVDTEKFSPRPLADSDLRKDLSIGDSFVVGCATNVRRLEGLSVVISALRELRQMGRAVVFVLLGDGSYLQQLKDEADALGVTHMVRFVGRVAHSEVPRYYSLFNAFVVPRTGDDVCRVVTPLKPLEAMSMGIPLVVSENPALTELLGGGAHGVSFAVGDAVALANQINALLDDTDRRMQMGEHARDWVVQNRRWEVLALLTKNIYKDLGCQPRAASFEAAGTEHCLAPSK